MKKRKQKTLLRRVLNSISSLALIGGFFYVMFTGMNLFSGFIMSAAITGLAVPAIASGEGIFECFIGFFEALMEGVADLLCSILEGIGGIFG